MNRPKYGELELLAEHELDIERARVCDPLGRFVALFEDDDVMHVVDAHSGELVRGATFRGVRDGRLDLAGRRLVTRTEGGLAILASSGERIEARTVSTPRTSAWNEAYGFSGDGRYVWLASTNREGFACLSLFDDRLEQLDVIEDLRSFAHPWPQHEPERLQTWGDGCWCTVQHHAPGTLLAVCNAGDSFFAAFAVSFDNGRIRVDQESLQRAIFAVDHYFLRALEVTARGELLMMDRDSHISILPWPPASDAEARVLRRSATSTLRAQSRPSFDLDVVGNVSTTRDHVHVGLESGDQSVALLVLDPATLDVLGLIEAPANIEGMLHHLGSDHFYATTDRGTGFWRLTR